jgi:hypothetical protein
MNGNNIIETASSYHDQCFICKRKTSSRARLRKIRKESVIKAYLEHKILLKHHSRCCSEHLDENGLIIPRIFSMIPTKPKYYSKQAKIMLNALDELKSKNVFDKFKDIAELTEAHCFKITRWSKDQFIRFSNFITSIYQTDGRTKEELIAIYRYWLRKGLDQCSLAMFKNKTSQQKISHYLSQIRVAINKDFVPFFLGVKSRNREFFVEHNNVTVTELYQMKNDELAIVVDGIFFF